jgi:hypothetical protein
VSSRLNSETDVHEAVERGDVEAGFRPQRRSWPSLGTGLLPRFRSSVAPRCKGRGDLVTGCDLGSTLASCVVSFAGGDVGWWRRVTGQAAACALRTACESLL